MSKIFPGRPMSKLFPDKSLNDPALACPTCGAKRSFTAGSVPGEMKIRYALECATGCEPTEVHFHFRTVGAYTNQDDLVVAIYKELRAATESARARDKCEPLPNRRDDSSF